MNKRGEERIFSIWWFVVVVVVSSVFVLSTSHFFSKDIDTKQFEAGILYEKIMECLTENGYLRADFNSGFNIYKECSLNKGIFDDGGIYYFSVSLGGERILQGGDKSLEADCSVADKDSVNENFPGCINRTEDILVNSNGAISKSVLNVMTSSNQDVESYILGGKNE